MVHIKEIIAKKRKQLAQERKRKQFVNKKLAALTDVTLIDRMTK